VAPGHYRACPLTPAGPGGLLRPKTTACAEGVLEPGAILELALAVPTAPAEP
jgi:hypothetical protein